MIEQFTCPRCNRALNRAGDIYYNAVAQDVSVFQCDKCLEKWSFDGAEFEIAFTFVVTSDGVAYSLDTFEPL